MTELHIRIPQNQTRLESAIYQFMQDEFQQSSTFKNESGKESQHKDGGLLGLLWQFAIVTATIEGTLQFADRVKRLERVKKLHAVIQQEGKPVYIKFKNKTVDLYHTSADEIMNILAGDDKK